MIWFLIYASAISLYDLSTRCIPNWYTFPILLAGFIAYFPGQAEIWLACFALVFAWAGGYMGAGDVKLWLALLWALPVEFTSSLLPLMFLSFLLTSLFQLLWRVLRKHPLVEQKTPAAWRTIPFLILCWYVH